MIKDLSVGYAFTGSFCTFEKSLNALETLMKTGAKIIPILSENASRMSTRYMNSKDLLVRLETMTGRTPITTIQEAEPIGPKKLVDIIVVAPCTGNTLSKLANSITDTTVLMACKSHLRNCGPILLSISTNDGLSGSLKNIGILLNTKNYYFVPFGQDDPLNKPYSLTSHMDMLNECILDAMNKKQTQPILKLHTLV